MIYSVDCCHSIRNVTTVNIGKLGQHLPLNCDESYLMNSMFI